MPTPEPNLTDPRPDQATTPAPTPDQNVPATPKTNPAKDGTIPTSTQENMGDGAGIRGDYGDASQTNGLEGGPDQVLTDTELTGS